MFKRKRDSPQKQHLRDSRMGRHVESSTSLSHPQVHSPPVHHAAITSAINTDEPSAEDIKQTEELLRVLKNNEEFETAEETDHRQKIMFKLSNLFKDWVKKIALKKRAPEDIAEHVGGKIFTFGSYRMNVHNKGADIDALFVAPNIIKRTDYFTSFFHLLKEQPEVSMCRSVESAFVPVIKLQFNGIDIDLLFARMSVDKVPDNFDLADDNLLKNMDVCSVRSLNGSRVTDAIMSLVPRVDNFRVALRSIRLWAKKEGIYSNALGYFGGVTWAMLVARTCQCYPNASGATLVYKFFKIFANWSWPTPVLLKRAEMLDLSFPVWDPRINVSDRNHLMPVITPVYPQQNSAFNVSESTKSIIMDKINRGMAVAEKIMTGAANWEQLFEPPSFFYAYRHFIIVLAKSQTASDHTLWCGLVESKMRLLTTYFERNEHISLVHIHPKRYVYEGSSEEINVGSAPFCTMWFIALDFGGLQHLNINLTEQVLYFKEQMTWAGDEGGIIKEGMDIEVHYAKRKDLHQFLGVAFLESERKTRKIQDESVEGESSAKRRKSESPAKEECEPTTPKNNINDVDTSIMLYGDDDGSVSWSANWDSDDDADDDSDDDVLFINMAEDKNGHSDESTF